MYYEELGSLVIRGHSIKSILAGIRKYIVACVTIDTRSLAVFRAIMGVLIVVDILLRSRNFHRFYTERVSFRRRLRPTY